MLAVLAAAICVSTVPTAVKIGLSGQAEPFQLLAPRMVLGATLLWLWVSFTRPHRIRIDVDGLGACALAGVVNAASISLFYLALTRLDVSIANIVFLAYPAMLLGMLLARGEVVTRLDWLRLALAMSGIWLIAGPGGSPDLLGLVFSLGGAAAYAGYVNLVHSRLTPYPVSTQALWIVTCMALTVQIPAAFFTPRAPLDGNGWAVVLWSAVLGTFLARMLNLTGIRLLGGGQMALLAPFETVLTVAWAAILLDESMSVLQLVGGALVLGSVGLAVLGGRWRVWAGTPRVAVAVQEAGSEPPGPTARRG